MPRYFPVQVIINPSSTATKTVYVTTPEDHAEAVDQVFTDRKGNAYVRLRARTQVLVQQT